MVKSEHRTRGKAIGWHVTNRLVDDRVIAPSAQSRRVAARAIVEQAVRQEARLLAFRVVDTHFHLLLVGTYADAGELARCIEITLRARLPLSAPFEPLRRMPIHEQGHLYGAYRYVLRQEERHGICVDPEHDGSSPPDLLGLRVIEGATLATCTREHLPRLSLAEFARSVGIGQPPNVLRAEALAEAAAAAMGLGKLSPMCRESRIARIAASWVATFAGKRTREIAGSLSITPRSVQLLRKERSLLPRGLARAVAL
ncbi:MAG: hypothetical protein HOW73_03460 [Polyangiaceae bacterium]|nr:hypothetical protein [Polyangiaceae bacterium]